MEADWATAGRAQVEDFRRRHRIGLVTLLFTDIIGSTQLKQTLGDVRAVTLIQRHHAALREVLGQFSEGEEIDTAGDSFFIVFAKPSDAVKYSLQVEAKLRALARENGATVFDRVGIHVGEVFIDDAPSGTRSRDLFGLQVDTCARIMSLGGAHQILASRFAFDSARQVLKGEDIAGIGPLSWLNHGTYSLKGVDESIEICEVGEEGEAALARPCDSEKAQRHVAPGDEPVLGWRPAAKQAVPNTKWILEKNLGEGGFGEVWLGRHDTLKRRRVFKFCFNADRVRSLKREVTIFRLLKENVGAHPNIVAIEDVFFDEPPFYIVMEYVEGDNLRGWCETKGGPDAIPIETRLDIIAQIADALQAAHESGVIHRDVKPQNILIQEVNGSPEAKLTDFGIGKVLSEEVLSGMTRLGFTQTLDSAGQQSGTQMYMAPEVVTGQPATTLSDIYSLGVVLYQFLIGDFSRPLTTDWEEEVSDPLLRDDLRHCFARNPDKRFAAARQLGDNLRSLPQRHAAFASQQAAAAARERAAYRRGVIRAGAVALLIVGIVAGLAFFALVQARRASRARDEARATLSQSDFLQAIRTISDGRSADAVAQLVRSLSFDPNNEAAGSYLLTLLTHRSFNFASLLLRHDGQVWRAEFSPDGKRIVTASADRTARVWDAQSGSQLTKPLLHDGKVYSARFSPDGKQIVTASWDRTARVWDAQSGNQLTRPLQHDLAVNSAEFSPDGKRIVTASADKTARVWDVQSGRPLTKPLQHDGGVFSAEFSPDGRQIITASADNTARVWDAQSGKPLTDPLKHDGFLNSAEFSPDGRQIVTASADNTARVWDAQSGRQLIEPLKHDSFVSSAQFSPEGKRIVTGSGDKTARVWDAQSGKQLTEPLKHDGQVGSAQFSPDGKRIVTASADKTVRVWDAQSGKQLGEPLHHNGRVVSAEFSPDGKWIVTGCWDNTARVWDAARQNGKQLTEPLRHDGELRSAEFSPDGTRIVTASLDRSARVWDARSGRPLTDPLKHDGFVNSAKFSPDGRRIVTASADKTARIWDAQSGKQLTESLKHGGEVYSAEFSPDGKRIATTCEDKTARVWDAQNGTQLTKPLKIDDEVNYAEFSPDGKRIATIGNKTVRIWDTESGNQLTEPMKHDSGVRGVQFSPDGERIVTASFDTTARVWDAHSGKPLIQPLRHDDAVHSAKFSPDGKRIVTASEDKTARIWDAQTGKELAEPLQHDGVVLWSEFSPDGKRIVTASTDTTARVWDAQSGKQLTVPLQHDGMVSEAHFSPDGKRIVTACTDKTARVWDAPPRAEAIPGWLPRLAEAVAGQRLNDIGSFESLAENQSKILNEVRDELSKAPTDDEWAIWGRWFLADRSTRTISPYSKITIPEYIENRIKESTQTSLDEAEMLAAGNAELLQRITQARETLPKAVAP